MGCKGGAEIAVEIREKRSSPKVGSCTNHRRSFGNKKGFPKHLAVSACFWLALSKRFDGTMGRCCPSDRRAINHTFLRHWRVLETREIIARRSAGQSLFVYCGCCSEPSPEGVLEGGF